MAWLLFEKEEIWVMKDMFWAWLVGLKDNIARFECVRFSKERKEITVTNQFSYLLIKPWLPNDILWDDWLVWFDWSGGDVYINYSTIVSLKEVASIKWDAKKKVVYIYDNIWNYEITDIVYNNDRLKDKEYEERLKEYESKNKKDVKKKWDMMDWEKYYNTLARSSFAKCIGEKRDEVVPSKALIGFLKACGKLSNSWVLIGKKSMWIEVLGNDKNYRLLKWRFFY